MTGLVSAMALLAAGVKGQEKSYPVSRLTCNVTLISRSAVPPQAGGGPNPTYGSCKIVRSQREELVWHQARVS